MPFPSCHPEGNPEKQTISYRTNLLAKPAWQPPVLSKLISIPYVLCALGKGKHFPRASPVSVHCVSPPELVISPEELTEEQIGQPSHQLSSALISDTL